MIREMIYRFHFLQYRSVCVILLYFMHTGQAWLAAHCWLISRERTGMLQSAGSSWLAWTLVFSADVLNAWIIRKNQFSSGSYLFDLSYIASSNPNILPYTIVIVLCPWKYVSCYASWLRWIHSHNSLLPCDSRSYEHCSHFTFYHQRISTDSQSRVKRRQVHESMLEAINCTLMASHSKPAHFWDSWEGQWARQRLQRLVKHPLSTFHSMAKTSGADPRREQDIPLTPPDQVCKHSAAKLEARQEASTEKPNEAK